MRKDVKRLFIYLFFSFGLSFVWFIIASPQGKYWDDMSYEMQSFIALGMLFPMIAHVLTRLVTKEGFPLTGQNSMMLGITLKNRKWIYYLLAALLPWFFTELGNLIKLLLNPDLYDPHYYISLGIEKNLLMLFPLNAIVTGSIVSFAAFGEEGGWRGYMMPKLLKIMNRRNALILGGIIWGLWHAPLTCLGHNFGTDYPGFPYVGIIKMCFFCIVMGVLLTFVTEMSGSVWPAAILHGVVNAAPSILAGYINPENTAGTEKISYLLGERMISYLLAAIIILLFWKRIENRNNNF